MWLFFSHKFSDEKIFQQFSDSPNLKAGGVSSPLQARREGQTGVKGKVTPGPATFEGLRRRSKIKVHHNAPF